MLLTAQIDGTFQLTTIPKEDLIHIVLCK